MYQVVQPLELDGQGLVYAARQVLVLQGVTVSDSTSAEIRVEISSPPDRDFVVANIMVGGHEFAEVDQEEGALRVEIYPRQDAEPWRFDYADLVRAIELAGNRLQGTRE